MRQVDDRNAHRTADPDPAARLEALRRQKAELETQIAGLETDD